MLLAVNTSTRQFSVALMEESGPLLAEYFMAPGPAHFRNFMPFMEEMFSRSRLPMGEVKALSVAKGPGSFTGLRIGLSMAKGMAQGLGIEIIGVSSLEAMANQMPYTPYPICPVIDSRKGEIFTALFKWQDESRLVRIREDTCEKITDLARIVDQTTCFLGNDFQSQAHLVRNILDKKAFLAPPHLWNLKASSVGALGLRRFLAQDFDDVQELIPVYLRPPI